jgi:hypothetical protein
MTTAYTSLLGLALPVTGELSGTWGDTVNTAITSLLDTAIAGTTSITTDADITLSTTTGASNQARQAIILWNPASGTTTRNITAPAQSKMYVVINASGGTQSIVIRGVGPTTGVTIAKGESATVAWNGSDFVKVSSSGGAITFTDLTVTGNTILGDAAADTLTVNATSTFNAPVSFAGLVRLPSTGRSAAAALTVTAPAFLYGVASTYTDTTSSGTIAAMAPFYSVAQPTLSTSNVTTYTNAATLYIANAPAAGGSATITNPYALYSAAGANYFGGAATFNSTLAVNGNTTLGDAAGDTLTINGTAVSVPNNLNFDSNTLFIDATNNRVGVNTATPSEVFDVYNGRIQNSGNNATAFDVYQTYASAFPTNEKYWRTQVYTDGTVGTTQSRFQFINDAYNTASTWMTVRRNGIALLGVVFNEDSNDADFRIESDGNTHAFFLDGGTSKIGINNSTPVGDLDVIGTAGVYLARSGGTGSDGRVLYLKQFNDYGYSFNIDSSSTGKLFIKAVNAGVESSLIEWDRTSIAQFNYGSAVFNEGGAAYDFRVESDTNTHMFFVNGADGKISMGLGSTQGTNDTLTIFQFGSSVGNNAQITLDANNGGGSGQAALRLLAGSGSINRAARVDFLNGVNSTTVPRWTLLNDYNQDGTNDFNIITGGSDQRMVMYTTRTVFNETGNDVDFRIESDSNTHMFFVDAGNNNVVVGNSANNGPSGNLFSVQGTVSVGNRLTSNASATYNLELSGYAVSDGGSRYGSYGNLYFYATPSYTGSARQFLLTNAYKANNFALIRGNTSSGTQPYIGTLGAVVDGQVFLSIDDSNEIVINEESEDIDFRVASDGNSHALFVDASNNKVAINSASVFAGAALNVYNGGILNYVNYSLSGTTPVALSQTMTGGLYVMRDDLNGGTCLVLYENGGTPIIVSQSSVGNYTTATPSGSQVKLSANGSDGIAASMAAGQTTTLRVMALICDPN